MKFRIALPAVIVFLILFAFPSAVYADGIIIPDPPVCDVEPCYYEPAPMEQLAIRYHHVTVTITDQLAVTHIDQVFYNPNDWTVEGTYLFPLPLDAAVSDFHLWIDGQAVEGQVLEAEQAREKYEDIVRAMQDPALLEYADRGAIQASIYPIEPDGERRIELEYTQVLTVENGLVQYEYPLNTEKFSSVPLEDVSISVDITSSQAIRAVYSPSHNVDTTRENDNHVVAGYEDTNVIPDTDFILYYSIGETEAFHLFTYRDPSDPTDPDGFFLMLLAPQPDIQSQVVAKDVFLVLDRSGSMEGDKFRQAQQATRYVLDHLNANDRFNIITFSTGLDTYASQLRPASEASQAISWIDSLSAEGSTDINRALLEVAASADPERPTYLLFLTDGLPTQGEINTDKILANFAASAPDNLRLFAFGVGWDVDTLLLDSLTQEHHGASTYIDSSEGLDEVISAFYAKISAPVLTDLKIAVAGLSTYDIYPSPLPDLFIGSQIVIVGRYRDGGQADVTLTGSANGQTQTFQYTGQTFAQESSTTSSTAVISRLWATRKIGYLLSQIRLNGPDEETVAQIVKLSIRYGIVTEYTSYLVTEPEALGSGGAQNQIVQDEMNRLYSATQAVSGQGAVDKAADEGLMLGAAAPAEAPAEVASQIRSVGSRTFLLTDGIWIDTGYDPSATQPAQIAFLSDDYFTLTNTHPELAPILALGSNVIFLIDGDPYQIVDAGSSVAPVIIPPSSSAGATPTPAQVPVSNGPTPTFEPAASATAEPTSQTSSGLCAAGLIPIILLLFVIAVVVKK